MAGMAKVLAPVTDWSAKITMPWMNEKTAKRIIDPMYLTAQPKVVQAPDDYKTPNPTPDTLMLERQKRADISRRQQSQGRVSTIFSEGVGSSKGGTLG